MLLWVCNPPRPKKLLSCSEEHVEESGPQLHSDSESGSGRVSTCGSTTLEACSKLLSRDLRGVSVGFSVDSFGFAGLEGFGVAALGLGGFGVAALGLGGFGVAALGLGGFGVAASELGGFGMAASGLAGLVVVALGLGFDAAAFELGFGVAALRLGFGAAAFGLGFRGEGLGRAWEGLGALGSGLASSSGCEPSFWVDLKGVASESAPNWG